MFFYFSSFFYEHHKKLIKIQYCTPTIVMLSGNYINITIGNTIASLLQVFQHMTVVLPGAGSLGLRQEVTTWRAPVLVLIPIRIPWMYVSVM